LINGITAIDKSRRINGAMNHAFTGTASTDFKKYPKKLYNTIITRAIIENFQIIFFERDFN
jgi:hypothetical protein